MRYKKQITLMLTVCFLIVAVFSYMMPVKAGKNTIYNTVSYEGWDTGTTGSVKYLDGSTVMVCIFLNTTGQVWYKDEKKHIEKNMEIACDFLVNEGKRYQKDVEIIYNFDSGSDLNYELRYDEVFMGTCSTSDEKYGDAVSDMYFFIMDYIHNNISSVDIMEKYNVDSIGYLVFIDGESTEACAYSYYDNYNTYYEEIAMIPIKWTGGMEVNPDTYAHEILHLFGARDLYTTKKISGITKEFVIYAGDKYPEDIMLGYATDGVSWEDSISSEITSLTAYFIGWKGYISELEKFPSIESESKASFSIVDYPGNYEEFTLEGKKTDEKTFKANIVEAVLSIGILTFFVISSIRNANRVKAQRDYEEGLKRHWAEKDNEQSFD
ncbi:MAG: hypothetical protein E7258_08475 [Lachnospiraceae bacterium]|nr:hypothetical protein [Lachnospiraceae bacterium]